MTTSSAYNLVFFNEDTENMAKKKAKPSAFSVFMHEFLEKERLAGRRYPKVSICMRVHAITQKHRDWKSHLYMINVWTGTMGISGGSTLQSKSTAFILLLVFQFNRAIEWFTQRLTPDQKEAYNQKAKGLPARTVVVPPKFTSQGIPLEVVEREERELAEKENYMKRKVNSIVENAFLENGKPFHNL